jgi:hypothetical protein
MVNGKRKAFVRTLVVVNLSEQFGTKLYAGPLLRITASPRFRASLFPFYAKNRKIHALKRPFPPLLRCDMSLRLLSDAAPLDRKTRPFWTLYANLWGLRDRGEQLIFRRAEIEVVQFDKAALQDGFEDGNHFRLTCC